MGFSTDSFATAASVPSSDIDLEAHSVTPDLNDEKLDNLIARDFIKLSFRDRNAINEELHGVSSLAKDESPEILVDAIMRMSMELEKIQNKPAFDKSQQWNSFSPIKGVDCTQNVYSYTKKTLAAGTHSTFVNTLDFRLRFLRAELFDPRKAALRMVKYLELIMDLYDWDEELLRRPIGLCDLKNKEEKECLKLGNHQLLPFRDRSGRRVIAMVPDMTNLPCIRLRAKVFLYLWSAAADNDETQRKGVVLVIWPRKSQGVGRRPFLPAASTGGWWLDFVQSIPIRICAYHICHDKGGPLIAAMLNLAGSVLVNDRIRMKVHTGDRTEISYQLLGYGIPVDLLPITDSGNVKTKNLMQWIKVRKVMEDNKVTNVSENGMVLSKAFFDNNIECPGLNDVIFRSGKNHLSHPGNVMFQGLIESRHHEHSTAHQDHKAVISWWVVEQVELKGGRFLEWNEKGMWSRILDRAHIRYKVSSCFRTFRRKLNAFENSQTNNSSTSKFTQNDRNKRRRLGNATFCNTDQLFDPFTQSL